LKIGAFFPPLFKLIAVNGKSKQIAKSRNFDYILQRKDELKGQYSPDEVEFIISKSEIQKCRKPEYREFKNLPEWDVSHWGINASKQYYAANKDLSKIVLLVEINR